MEYKIREYVKEKRKTAVVCAVCPRGPQPRTAGQRSPKVATTPTTPRSTFLRRIQLLSLLRDVMCIGFRCKYCSKLGSGEEFGPRTLEPSNEVVSGGPKSRPRSSTIGRDTQGIRFGRLQESNKDNASDTTEHAQRCEDGHTYDCTSTPLEEVEPKPSQPPHLFFGA